MKNQVAGVPFEGEDIVLSEIDDDLTKGLNWSDQGFTICDFLEDELWSQFLNGFELLFKKCLKESGLQVDDDFEPKHYHRLVGNDQRAHLKVINQTKLFQSHQFPIDFTIVEERISEILETKVKSVKPFNGERVFHFRVIRPNSPDYNPIHRDVWQDENRDAINIYVPLTGSNDLSSLLIVPGSHRWSESLTIRSEQGAKMNGLSFNVPGLIESKKELQMIRPNPKHNEVLVFSPYLLHGLSENLNTDSTRISLEMRFWRVK